MSTGTEIGKGIVAADVESRNLLGSAFVGDRAGADEALAALAKPRMEGEAEQPLLIARGPGTRATATQLGYATGMPFESSLPLVVASVLCGLIATCIWTRNKTMPLLAIAIACFLAAIGLWITDRLVVTDREYLQDLFPRLAESAEQQDIPAIVAAVDPELHPLRQEAEQVLKRVKPTRILITHLDVAVESAESPPQATADLVVRVAGNTIEAGTPGDILAEFRVLLHKKDGTWLIRDVEADRARLGQPW